MRLKTGHGIKSEAKTARRMGARVVPGSGALEGYKGDLRTSGYMIECKSTVSSSLSLKHDWLRKVTDESRRESLKPALHVAFVTPDGQALPGGKWIMVREVDFLALLDK